jgi:hypothetical protein
MQNTSSLANQRLVYLRADGSAQESPCAMLQKRDPVMLTRKGVLHFLSYAEVSTAILDGVCEQYYTNRCYDPIPCLKAALGAAYQEHPELRRQLPVVVVAQGLEISIVGTEEAAVWLLDHSGTRELFMPWKTGERYAVSGEDTPLYSTQWRLTTADAVIISTASAARRLDARALARALRKGSAESAVEALSRGVNQRRKRQSAIPIGLIHVPGFKPTPSFTTPMQDAAMATAMPTLPRPRSRPVRRQTSPILIALLVSALALTATIWIKRPAITVDELSDMFVAYMLTPAASPTPDLDAGEAVATPEPPPVETPVPDRATDDAVARNDSEPLSPPELVSPGQDDTLRGARLRLVWSWDGDLAEDEFFDVRMWRLGRPQESLGLTKDTEVEQRPSDEGWHAWTVVVVRSHDGVVEEEVSDEPMAVSFRWRPEGATGYLFSHPVDPGDS